jgi:uncharacterized repeat protein (TIGR01451 family)
VASLRRLHRAIGVTLGGLAVLCLLSVAPPAFAEGIPAWSITSIHGPTNLVPGSAAQYVLVVSNIGTAASFEPIEVTDALPSGVTATAIENAPGSLSGSPWSCTLATVTCTSTAPVKAGFFVKEIVLKVHVASTVVEGQQLVNKVMVSGGGAVACGGSGQPLCASASESATVSASAPSSGVQSLTAGLIGAGGAPYTQAGGHPYEANASFEFNTHNTKSGYPYPVGGEPKNVVVQLPAGLVGNPLAAASQCPVGALQTATCSRESQVGVIDVGQEGEFLPVDTNVPVYNLVPEPGYPAEFGFIAFTKYPILVYPSVRTGGDYGLTLTSPNIIEARATGALFTFWGVPADFNGGGRTPAALMTAPTDCALEALEPPSTLISIDTWAEPSVYTPTIVGLQPGVTGCNLLSFEPSVSFTPSSSSQGGTTAADEPTGIVNKVTIPQNEAVSGLATPQLKDVTLTLPEGMSISPAGAGGLRACPAEGPEGFNLKSETAPDANDVRHGEPGHCPEASRVATVKVTTPLLASPLSGHVYLAQPLCGGEGQPACTEASAANGELFRLYLEAEGSGVVVKVAGTASADPRTGRLTATFQNTPQLPFSELEVVFKGGPRAPLANSQTCGPARTTSDLTPWSAPDTPDATPSSAYEVTGCASPTPFHPGFLAQTSSSAAGAFSPFTLTFSRNDREQDLSAIQLSTPPGLLGMLSSVSLCGEPQAAQGTCPSSSEIGTTTVAAGSGEHPFGLSGSVYLTTGYKGAPFGLSIVVPAIAGPFNLGNVVVRAAINVNPSTAALTITSAPLPQIIDGVPIRLRSATVAVNRSDFMFNPTSCAAQSISATLASAQGASASVSSPFAAGGCKGLAFKPSFTASTQAKTSRANGASLDVKVSYPKGIEANIKSVKVELPKQLPSRLTTLQKACLAATFEANPAACPAGSVVGVVKASTPVLPVQLSGPAYFVSHGGEAFPSLIVVLQGDGVRVNLVGATFISKAGITSSTFNSVPDVPVSSFELTLPRGRYSALAANENLCKQKLIMPTTITGQNGAVIHQRTKIAVTGCPKTQAKPLTNTQKLGKALKACKKKPKKERAGCATRARKAYAIRSNAKKPAKKSSNRNGKAGR